MFQVFTCSHCHKILEKPYDECPHCGVRIKGTVCPHCGLYGAEDYVFSGGRCPKCTNEVVLHSMPSLKASKSDGAPSACSMFIFSLSSIGFAIDAKLNPETIPPVWFWVAVVLLVSALLGLFFPSLLKDN